MAAAWTTYILDIRDRRYRGEPLTEREEQDLEMWARGGGE